MSHAHSCRCCHWPSRCSKLVLDRVHCAARGIQTSIRHVLLQCQRSATAASYHHQFLEDSSVVTVQHLVAPGSSPSRTLPGEAPQNVPFVAHAVSGGNTSFSNNAPASSRPRRRSSATHSRSSSLGGVKEGLLNLDRWSQSTSSSRGSVGHKRSSSFGRRMSFGGSLNFGSPASQDSEDRSSPSRWQSTREATANSPSRRPASRAAIETSSHPSTLLPPIITLPSLQQSVSVGSSPITGTPAALTPSTSGLLSAATRTVVPDYFGERWDGSPPRDDSRARSASRTGAAHVDRSPVAPATRTTNGGVARRPSLNADTAGSRGHSRNRSHAAKSSTDTGSSRGRGQKPPSQKAMLSKALQKANTAVLLDNAQNFEGAVLAYSEACELLQQVMMRTSGEDDRAKLEAIVSLNLSGNSSYMWWIANSPSFLQCLHAEVLAAFTDLFLAYHLHHSDCRAGENGL